MARMTEKQINVLRGLLVRFKEKHTLKRLRAHQISRSEASLLIGNFTK